mmetsp:Transcript_83276/g.231085  ORF Transcript_83276/g.231085 Transcript_83276/m.231085 type:complete len:269 (-) Transcript_83276:23-829(-)
MPLCGAPRPHRTAPCSPTPRGAAWRPHGSTRPPPHRPWVPAVAPQSHPGTVGPQPPWSRRRAGRWSSCWRWHRQRPPPYPAGGCWRTPRRRRTPAMRSPRMRSLARRSSARRSSARRRPRGWRAPSPCGSRRQLRPLGPPLRAEPPRCRPRRPRRRGAARHLPAAPSRRAPARRPSPPARTRPRRRRRGPRAAGASRWRQTPRGRRTAWAACTPRRAWHRPAAAGRAHSRRRPRRRRRRSRCRAPGHARPAGSCPPAPHRIAKGMLCL